MNIIILFIIPFCFGFIISRASENGDMVTTTIALVGIIADLMLIILERGKSMGIYICMAALGIIYLSEVLT